MSPENARKLRRRGLMCAVAFAVTTILLIVAVILELDETSRFSSGGAIGALTAIAILSLTFTIVFLVQANRAAKSPR